ncbi:MAG: hypothetical protein Kow00124_03960 [Anaerolineae bacterium]
MTLFYLSAAWLAGIVFAGSTRAVWWVWLIPAAISLPGLYLARPGTVWRLVFGCALLFALGGTRYTLAIPRIGPEHIAHYNDQGFVTLEGVLIDAPDPRDSHTNLRIRVDLLYREGEEPIATKGLVLVQATSTQAYQYGDRVQVTGELSTPPVFDEFSYRDYLARQGIHSLMRFARVRIIGSGEGNPIRAAMLDFRDRAHRAIKRLLPEPQASLLAGILLGIESGISPDVREAFNRTDTTHIIAISGSNMVIIAGLIMSITRRFLRERWAIAATIAGVVAYAIFVGGDAAVLRAAIMTTLTLVATALGRETYGMASLGFAALLLTAINPLMVEDLSFQLSFLATLGLILYVDPLQHLLEHGVSRWVSSEHARQIVGALSDSLLVTVAVQITTRPLLAYTTGQASLVSLPVNLLIVPLQAPLMVLGGLGVLAALIFWPLGQVIAWGSWLFLSLTLWIVRNFARLPFASVDLGAVSLTMVIGVYAMIFGLTVLAGGSETARSRRRAMLDTIFSVRALAGAGVITAALLFTAAFSLPDGRLHVTFINVGDGNATLIETPSGRQVLVDAGGSGRQVAAGLGDALPFWDRRLDVLVLTGQGSRQIGGLQHILERYRFDTVLTPSVIPLSAESQPVFSALAGGGAQIAAASDGMRVQVDDGTMLTILLPAAAGNPAGEEAPAAVLVTYGEARFLLTGDLTEEAERALLNEHAALLDATVLLIPRGGHREAASEGFLTAVKPQACVLSIDAGNRYNLPHEETLARLASLAIPLYRTDQQGTIQMASDGESLHVRTAR